MNRRVVNPWTWQDAFGFVQANEVTEAGRILHCAGQASVDADGAPVHPGDMVAQANQALDNLEQVLEGAGMGIADVTRLNYYVTDLDGFFAAAEQVLPRLVAKGCRPTSTLLGVQRLAFPGADDRDRGDGPQVADGMPAVA